MHPKAIVFWDRPILLNFVLFGNYKRLRNNLLSYISPDKRIVLFGSCYGDLVQHLHKRAKTLTVVDCVALQLESAVSKCNCDTMLSDVAQTGLPCGSADIVVMFFMLHELPSEWKQKTLAEAYRITGKDGKVVICEFAKPAWWNPFGYLEYLIFRLFEPFANEILKWRWEEGAEQHHFGRLYRIIESDVYSAQQAQSDVIVQSARAATTG